MALSLNRVHLRSTVDATDSKGEPIHQTLMAKKMQRLDESLDFRPFKFRIQVRIPDINILSSYQLILVGIH